MATNPTSPVSAAPQPAAMPEEKFALTSSRHFPEWLARAGASLAFERTFARCMGLGVSPDARSLVLATQYQLLRFDNVVSKGGAHGEHDAVFSPHIAWITGDIDAHDVAIAADGRPVFVTLAATSAVESTSDAMCGKTPLDGPPCRSRTAPTQRRHCFRGLITKEARPRRASPRPNRISSR
jgi:Domain of unknown function (DUF4915)